MSRGVNANTVATAQRLFVVQPMIGFGCRMVRDAEHLALRFESIPQPTVVGMQTNRRTGQILYLCSRQDMIQMGMRMDQCLELKTKARDDLHDAFRMPARIENVATAGLSVSKHCAVALKRANGKAFTDDGHRVTL